MKKFLAVAGFLACILSANYVTTEFGMIPVGFGLIATAGTYFAGLTFVLRDSIHDALGVSEAESLRERLRKASPLLGLIGVGVALSYLVSDPFVALASAVAFGCSEVADTVIYIPLRRRGYVRAALASNIVGAFVDTILFLWVAGFPIQQAIAGQVVGKVAVTVVVVAAVAALRVRRTLLVAA